MNEKRTRRHFTLAQKAEIVREADATGLAAASRKYQVTSGLVAKWRRKLSMTRVSRSTKDASAPDQSAYIAHLEARLAAQLVELERYRFHGAR